VCVFRPHLIFFPAALLSFPENCVPFLALEFILALTRFELSGQFGLCRVRFKVLGPRRRFFPSS